MKKIAIFMGFFKPHLGGIERYIDNLSRELLRNDYEVIIVTTRHLSKLKSIEKIDNVKIFRLPIFNIFKNTYPIIKPNKKYKEIINKLKKENVDFVLLNTRFHLTSMIGALFANKNNKKAILLEHGSGHFELNNKILRFLGEIYEHLLTFLLKIIVKDFYGVSKRCNNWLKHFKIKAKGVLYNAVDDRIMSKFNNYKDKKYKGDSKLLLTFSGRLIEKKGIYMLIDAFNELKHKHKGLRLAIAGSGLEFDKLKKLTKQDNDILMTGNLQYEEMMSLFKETDIFVNPSMYPEGLPTVLLEAGIMDCAVLATDRGGTVEVINKDSIGIVIKENKNDIVLKLRRLLNNKNKINIYKKNMKNRVLEEFTWGKTTSKLIKIIENEKKN